MIDRRRALLSILPAFTVVSGMLAACASPEPVLYTLEAVPGTPAPGAPRGVVLRDVALARHLDRPQLVRASNDYQFSLDQDNWWAEPLGRMVGRVLVEDLSQRLPGSMVIAEAGAIGAQQADAVVEVNIQAFAAEKSGNVRLLAQVAVARHASAAGRAAQTQDIVVPLPALGARGQVAAMSTALGQLSDVIAEMLRR